MNILNGYLPIIILFAAIVVIYAIIILSLKTYYIPVDSFIRQFGNMDEKKFREVTLEVPGLVFHFIPQTIKYKIFPVDVIKCEDKNGHAYEMQASPRLEIRFTDFDNNRTTFYFDTLFVSDTSVSGSRSRYLSLRKTLPLNNIRKIEIQDGRKRYKYV